MNEPQQPREKKSIVFDSFTEFDVILGRGNGKGVLPGNVHFRKLVKDYKDLYASTARNSKGKVALEVIGQITKVGGRFLECVNDKQYVEISRARVLEKTTQALREKKTNKKQSLEHPLNVSLKRNYVPLLRKRQNQCNAPRPPDYEKNPTVSLPPHLPHKHEIHPCCDQMDNSRLKVVTASQVLENDVLYGGRGRKFFSRRANQQFMKLLKDTYQRHNDSQKQKIPNKRKIAHLAYLKWKTRNPPGRFLSVLEEDNFQEIDEVKILDRLCQSIRDLERAGKVGTESNSCMIASADNKQLSLESTRPEDVETACILANLGSSHHRNLVDL